MNGLVGGSLYLSGPKVLSRLQTSQAGVGSLERFEGKTVYLREDGKVRPVKLIRASSGLVQDLQTGRFRSGISVGQLEFSQPLEPSGANSVRYRYTLERSGPAAVSLITRALNWSPRYVLSVMNGGSKLEAWADITNRDSSLKVYSSELIAGRVELVGVNRYNSDIGSIYAQAAVEVRPPMPSSKTGSISAPRVGAGREQQGLYSYKLSQGYTLPQNSVFSLPFLSPKVTVKRVARLETNFYSSFIKGKFQRLYRLTSNVLLPAGTVTVRDVDRVVGNQSLPDLTANEEHNLQLGQDPDLSFTRYVKVSSSSRVKVFGTVQRRYTYNIYSVTLQMKNAKARAVPFEYLERLEGRDIVLEGDVGRTAQGLSLRGTLPAKGSLERKYKVTFIEEGEAVPVAKKTSAEQDRALRFYSHSIVAGGFPVMS